MKQTWINKLFKCHKNFNPHSYIFFPILIYIHSFIHIYIYIERERETQIIFTVLSIFYKLIAVNDNVNACEQVRITNALP